MIAGKETREKDTREIGMLGLSSPGSKEERDLVDRLTMLRIDSSAFLRRLEGSAVVRTVERLESYKNQNSLGTGSSAMTDRSAKRPRTDGDAPSGVAEDPAVDADGVPDFSAALNEVQEELNKVRSIIP